MSTTIDLTDQRFGRWVVIGFSSRDQKHSYWRVRCDCGESGIVTMNSLRIGSSRSCGCLRNELTSAANTTHGDTKARNISSEYGIWTAMKARCYNPNVKRYADYGGRGITVCDEWRNDFAHFLADMGRRPEGFTIERKDNNGPYAPLNCEWASRKTQASNRRRVRLFTVNGVSMSAPDACTARGISYSSVRHRMDRGWPEEKWFDPPVCKRGA